MTDLHIIQLHIIKISFCNDNIMIKCKVERLFCLTVYHSNLNDIQKLENRINFRNLGDVSTGADTPLHVVFAKAARISPSCIDQSFCDWLTIAVIVC